MKQALERSALNYFPDEIDMPSIRAAAAGCRGCELYRNATQTVFGEGRQTAQVVFVGEQPGDEEDLAGRPFVGPAGRLFDRALAEAGIDRTTTYVTNVVKHFKWKPQGKRRLHQKPNSAEVEACLPWLAAELEILRPRILVLLGATAAQAILGNQFRVTQERGRWLASQFAERVIATVHPSSILRAFDANAREKQYGEFVDDLKKIAVEIGPD